MWGLFHRAPSITATRPASALVTSLSSLDSRMRVRFQATEWFALSEQPLTVQPGDRVEVVGRLNATTLLISHAEGRGTIEGRGQPQGLPQPPAPNGIAGQVLVVG